MADNQADDIIKKRRSAIRGGGYSLDKAAEVLVMGRTTLYAELDRVTLDDSFVQNVREKLGVDLEPLKGNTVVEGAKSYIDQLLAAKDEVAHLYKTISQIEREKSEREKEITNTVLASLNKHDTVLESLLNWKEGAARSILDLTADIVRLKDEGQKSVSPRGAKQKGTPHS